MRVPVSDFPVDVRNGYAVRLVAAQHVGGAVAFADIEPDVAGSLTGRPLLRPLDRVWVRLASMVPEQKTQRQIEESSRP